MKLHLVTRSDLPAGPQAVQAVHALREFIREHPEEDRVWYEKSNTIAFLAVQDEASLQDLLARARIQGIPASGFKEPDRDNELTAVAIGPSGKRLCRRLPLALAEDDACATSTPCTSTIAVKTNTEPSTITGAGFLSPQP